MQDKGLGVYPVSQPPATKYTSRTSTANPACQLVANKHLTMAGHAERLLPQDPAPGPSSLFGSRWVKRRPWVQRHECVPAVGVSSASVSLPVKWEEAPSWAGCVSYRWWGRGISIALASGVGHLVFWLRIPPALSCLPCHFKSPSPGCQPHL